MWRTYRGKACVSPEAQAYFDAAFVSWHDRIDWDYVDVEIAIILKTRKGDVDNRIKPVLDAITKARVWQDDKCVSRVSARLFEPDKKYPLGATFVRITEMEKKYGTREELSTLYAR